MFNQKMSFKAKDLHFERQEPAFLKKLKAGITDATNDLDRQINPLSRPKKLKRLENDDDDAPTYVVEDSNETLTKEEYEKLVEKSKDEDRTEKTSKLDLKDAVEDGPTTQEPSQPSQAAAGSRKRKAVKVIGDGDAGELEKPSTSKKPATTKAKKTKVKLSFDHEEED